MILRKKKKNRITDLNVITLGKKKCCNVGAIVELRSEPPGSIIVIFLPAERVITST